MNLVAPIVFFAIAMGMFCKRWGRNEFIVLSAWIILVIARYWIKGPL